MKKLGYRNALWLLPVLIVATALMMGQRRNHKDPSPADPGMRLYTPTPHGPKPEAPVDHDPEQGDEPDDPQDDYPGEVPIQQPDKPLKVTGMEVTWIQAGSDVGKSGDYMVVLDGEGFLEAERPPVVHIGDEVQLEEVYVNRTLGELYAVLPAAVASSLSALEFIHLAVQNPGGSNLDPSRWVRFPVVKADFLQSMESAPFKRYQLEGYQIKKM
jgi:hypothetical protein